MSDVFDLFFEDTIKKPLEIPDTLPKLTYLSLCSGIEAASVAWHRFGWTPLGFSEISKFQSAVLNTRFPTVTNFGDMNGYRGWRIERPLDVLVAGTPCQSFSLAGLRAGMADPRGNLALVFLGVVDLFRPRWIIWENVPGVLSSNEGRDFGSFLGGLVELGYSVSYRVLDAQYFGVAQRRRRVFVVAHLGDWRYPAAALFEREGLQGVNPSGGVPWKGAASEFEGNLEEADSGDGSVNLINRDFHVFVGKVKITPTLLARYPYWIYDSYNNSSNVIAHTLRCGMGDELPKVYSSQFIRRLTPIECERLQGFPDDWTKIKWNGSTVSDYFRYQAIGNSMAVPVMRWLGNRIGLVDSLKQ
jgi:DNA (cytosine-5)-methyltransferase 1